jgi:uncharacterized protein (DUF1697 family)
MATKRRDASAAPITRYALLLRGVNVGKGNVLPMAELRAMLEEFGCTGVQTYVQSGNAVFGTELEPLELTRAIESALARYMGRPIATTLRTQAELLAILGRNPFVELASDPKLTCVTFLSHAPAKTELEPLFAQDFAPDRFHVAGHEIYSLHPSGQGRSPLAAAIAKLKLRGAVTTRNWNTVQKLAALLSQ